MTPKNHSSPGSVSIVEASYGQLTLSDCSAVTQSGLQESSLNFKADANGDGLISKAEIAAALEANRAAKEVHQKDRKQAR
jgi:hypothetical protein